MKEIIEAHLGKEIGMNIENSTKIEPVNVREIHNSYFVVTKDKDENTYFIPFNSVVKTIENEDGVIVGGLFHHKKSYSLVVRLGCIVNFIS